MSRSEHVEWCKQRALEYLPSSPSNALGSMFSDLGKHPETIGHPAIELGMLLLLAGNLSDASAVQKFIVDFN